MQTKGFVVTIKKIILLWLPILLCCPWFLLHMHKHPPPTLPPQKILSSCVISCSPCVMQKFQVWVCDKILHPDWSKHIMWFCDWLAVPSSSLCLLCLFLYQTAFPLIRNIKKNAATAPMVPPMTATILLPGPKSKKWHEIMS